MEFQHSKTSHKRKGLALTTIASVVLSVFVYVLVRIEHALKITPTTNVTHFVWMESHDFGRQVESNGLLNLDHQPELMAFALDKKLALEDIADCCGAP